MESVSQNLRKLSTIVYGTTPNLIAASGIPALHLPSRHQRLYDSGRRLSPSRRKRQNVDLQRNVLPRRKLSTQTRPAGDAEHGQQRQGYERVSVFHHVPNLRVAGWEARCLWEGFGGWWGEYVDGSKV